MTETTRLLAALGTAFWAIGVTMVTVLALASLVRFFAFVNRGGRARHGRYARSLAFYRATVGAAGCAALIAGIVAVANPFSSGTVVAAVVYCLLGATLLSAACFLTTWSSKHGSGNVQLPRRVRNACLSSGVALVLVCIGAVCTNLFSLGWLWLVAIAVALLCGGQWTVWSDPQGPQADHVGKQQSA